MQQTCQIGFDVGGTTFKAALVAEGEILETVSAQAPVDQPQAEAIRVMADLIEKLKAAAERQQRQIQGVGMGIAGLVDYTRGFVITAPNLPTWTQFPLAEQLSQKIAMPVCLDNDVRAMALGELVQRFPALVEVFQAGEGEWVYRPDHRRYFRLKNT